MSEYKKGDKVIFIESDLFNGVTIEAGEVREVYEYAFEGRDTVRIKAKPSETSRVGDYFIAWSDHVKPYHTEFKVGDKVRVSYGVDGAEWVTTIVEVRHSSYGDQYRLSEWRNGQAGKQFWSIDYLFKLTKLEENETMTPAMEVTRENLSDKKVYVLKQDHIFGGKKGTAVVLDEDDGSNNPYFKIVNSNELSKPIGLVFLAEYGAEPEVTELTLEQVAQKFGLDTSSIRIKE